MIYVLKLSLIKSCTISHVSSLKITNVPGTISVPIIRALMGLGLQTVQYIHGVTVQFLE